MYISTTYLKSLIGEKVMDNGRVGRIVDITKDDCFLIIWYNGNMAPAILDPHIESFIILSSEL